MHQKLFYSKVYSSSTIDAFILLIICRKLKICLIVWIEFIIDTIATLKFQENFKTLQWKIIYNVIYLIII